MGLPAERKRKKNLRQRVVFCGHFPFHHHHHHSSASRVTAVLHQFILVSYEGTRVTNEQKA